ncbi:hypothetical protein [Shewanella frigidimarina]|uniref:hypothetical protein n=1 Tax=Shewanella frigidimarina TaxID=56812 RepID=UPI003D7B6CB2
MDNISPTSNRRIAPQLGFSNSTDPVFIIGYVIYAKFSLVIFFCGAIFVFAVCSQSLKTTSDMMQIHALKQENITDSLTGMFNRRYLDRRLKEETQRA